MGKYLTLLKTGFAIVFLLISFCPVNAGSEDEALLISESPFSEVTETLSEIYTIEMLNYRVTPPNSARLVEAVGSAHCTSSNPVGQLAA